MSREIELTNSEQRAICDDGDFGYLSRFRWYLNHSGYACRNVNNGVKTTYVSMARTVVGLQTGDERQVDHKNGNRLDNRTSNLRICSPAQNAMNMRKLYNQRNTRASDLYKGVSFHERTGQWRARIRHDGKDIHLGYFELEEDAAKAYDEASKKYRGEFACLNFPEEAPRPPEPKTLAEKIYDYWKTTMSAHGHKASSELAEIATAHFFDNKEEALADYLGGVGYNDISRRAINFLRGEGG